MDSDSRPATVSAQGLPLSGQGGYWAVTVDPYRIAPQVLMGLVVMTEF